MPADVEIQFILKPQTLLGKKEDNKTLFTVLKWSSLITVVVLIDFRLCQKRRARLGRGVSDKFSFYLKSRESEIVCSLKYASLLWSIFAPLNWLKRQNFVKFLLLEHMYIFLKTILWMLNLGQTVKKMKILSALSRSCFFLLKNLCHHKTALQLYCWLEFVSKVEIKNICSTKLLRTTTRWCWLEKKAVDWRKPATLSAEPCTICFFLSIR